MVLYCLAIAALMAQAIDHYFQGDMKNFKFFVKISLGVAILGLGKVLWIFWLKLDLMK